MRRAIALSLGIFFATTLLVAAQPARIKSGEHQDFSRLVLYFDRTVEAEISKPSERLARISIKNWSGGFNTDTIYEFIPRSRIAEVSAGDESLELTLNCACKVVSQQFSNSILI